MTQVRLTILGQPASKANSRQIVTVRDQPRVIKSPEARAYMEAARRQIPPAARVRLQGPVTFTAHLFYASELPDLDESLVLDALQDVWSSVRLRGGTKERVLVQAGVYRNDRQVREKHVYHHVDRARPRAEILIEPRQGDLFAGPGEAQGVGGDAFPAS